MDTTEELIQPPLSEAQPSMLPLHVRTELRTEIEKYRMHLRQSTAPATLLVGIDTCSGLTNQCIDTIVNNANKIVTPADLLHFGIASPEYCSTILEIIADHHDIA